MISLRKMTTQEFTNYLAASIQLHAEENSKSLDISIEESKVLAQESYKNLLPKNSETENHYFYSVISANSEKVIGSLWLGKREQASAEYAYIFDIILSPEERGKGFGKQLLALAERESKRLGFNSVALHVFGHNHVAINLYENAGFRKTNIWMRKDLQ